MRAESSSPAATPASMRWALSLGLIGLLALVVGVAVLDHHYVGVFHDDATYVILAKSLATGQGYRYLNLPGAPVATHFPPGYPALLALVWRIAPNFPANVVFFKLLNAAFLSASAMLVAQFVRERLGSDRWAAGTGVISAISVPLLVLVTMVLSEPLFLALLLVALLIAERCVAGTMGARRALALGVFVGAVTLVRSHGVVLLPAIALPLLLRRRWLEAALLAAGALSVLVPWQVWGAAQPGVLPAPLQGNYGSYAGWWLRGYRAMGPSMIGETILRTVPEASSMLAAIFSPVRGGPARAATLIALTALAVAGTITVRTRAPVTLLFLAGYAAIVFVWPFPPSRFVWGVWPLLLFVLAAAGWSITSPGRHWPSAARAVLAAALLWVGVGYAAYELRAERGAWWASISRAGSRRIAPAVAWTQSHTALSDVIAADDEGAVYLYTGRRAVPVASFTTAHYLRSRSAQLEAKEGLEPLLAAYPLRAVLVGSKATFDAADYLTKLPAPMLVLREQLDGGAAFTVLAK